MLSLHSQLSRFVDDRYSKNSLKKKKIHRISRRSRVWGWARDKHDNNSRRNIAQTQSQGSVCFRQLGRTCPQLTVTQTTIAHIEAFVFQMSVDKCAAVDEACASKGLHIELDSLSDRGPLRAGCRNARLTARLGNRELTVTARLTCGRVARSTVSKPSG